MSGEEQGAIPKGSVTQESNRAPVYYKFIEYKCGFKNREDVLSCPWTTGLIDREEAYKLLGEHWDAQHEKEHKDIQAERALKRERNLNKELQDLKNEEHKAEMTRQQELYKMKMANAAKLQRLQNGIINSDDLRAAGLEEMLIGEEGDEDNPGVAQLPGAGLKGETQVTQAFAEIGLAMKEQTNMFRSITGQLENLTGNISQNGEVSAAIKSLESLAQSQSKTKAILTKEPKCPKFIKGQKLEHYWKEYDEYEKDMLSCRPGNEIQARNHAVKELNSMLKECQNEEIRKYFISYILDNDEIYTSSTKIKEKINQKFGKTPKQEDRETRTRQKGMQLAGDISEYADYMRKQKKKTTYIHEKNSTK